MYYVIETCYVGPNHDQHVDADTICISSTPAVGNSSLQECVDGWCGTTNDWAVYGHGVYASVESARAALHASFGEVRDCDLDGDAFESYDWDVLETFKPGKYAPMGREAVGDWAHTAIMKDIEAGTSDARIVELAAEFEAEANSNGYALDGHIMEFLLDRRRELQDEIWKA
jgi:hypothetical protein